MSKTLDDLRDAYELAWESDDPDAFRKAAIFYIDGLQWRVAHLEERNRKRGRL